MCGILAKIQIETESHGHTSCQYLPFVGKCYIKITRIFDPRNLNIIPNLAANGANFPQPPRNQ